MGDKFKITYEYKVNQKLIYLYIIKYKGFRKDIVSDN